MIEFSSDDQPFTEFLSIDIQDKNFSLNSLI